MRKTLALLGAVLLFNFAATGAHADTKTDERLVDARQVFETFVDIKEQAIPTWLLERAYGIVVVPRVIKGALIIGGRGGRGVFAVRRPDGSWTDPVFITLAGANIGFQWGVQSTDVVLVLTSRESVEGMAGGKVTLGADASVAAGPRRTDRGRDDRHEPQCPGAVVLAQRRHLRGRGARWLGARDRRRRQRVGLRRRAASCRRRSSKAGSAPHLPPPSTSRQRWPRQRVPRPLRQPAAVAPAATHSTDGSGYGTAARCIEQCGTRNDVPDGRPGTGSAAARMMRVAAACALRPGGSGYVAAP